MSTNGDEFENLLATIKNKLKPDGRLETEFEFLEKIGSGGFGVVIKVRHYLDDCVYAIKIIQIPSDTKIMDKITREVKLLSQINHENVVRYYNAWQQTYTEEEVMGNLSPMSQEEESATKDTTESSEIVNSDSSTMAKAVSPRLTKDTTESSEIVNSDSSTMAKAVSPRLTKDTTESSEALIFIEDSKLMRILCIQMEYCENKTLRQLIDSDDLHTSEEKVWRLLREMAEGLEHIHSKGIIHRDLKPDNVFRNSSGHIKIGDFGLATSRKQHINKNTAPLNQPMVLTDGETEQVGTTMYMAPEIRNSKSPEYTQKVDTYSLGIMFFEMCHAPLSTKMEWYKILVEIRKPEISFPPTFDPDEPQAKVVRLLLDHNPHRRPSATELLQNSLLPPKMEDEELQEVLLRILQSPNSTRYQPIMNMLFAQDGSRVTESSYFMDPQDKRQSHHVTKSKFGFQALLLQQLVHSRLVAIFTRHGAVALSPPLLSLQKSSSLDSAAELMNSSGTILTLPYDLRSPFARYVCHQDISYLKRYSIAPVFREGKVQGSHPREHYECQFDIVTPNPNLMADAEVMYLVSEIIGEIPGLLEQQFCVWISHTSLLSAILTHCSIDEDKHGDAADLLHKMMNKSLRPSDLRKELKDYNIQLSSHACETLLRFVQNVPSMMSPEEVQVLLEPLLQSKSAGIASLSSQAWQEISTVAEFFRLFGAKEQMYLHPGLTHSHQQFSGVIFQFVHASTQDLMKSKCSKSTPLALGGRYDKLLCSFRRPDQSVDQPMASVVGVTIMSDVLEEAAFRTCPRNKYQASKCAVLVCWFDQASLQKECLELVRDLWTQGISADLLYDPMKDMKAVQQFCRRHKIPHLVVLGDKTVPIQKVKLRTFEGSKVLKKHVTFSELVEFLQPKHVSESTESKELIRGGSSDNQSSGGVPKVNTTVVVNERVDDHQKSQYHDQAVNKLHPLLQSFSTKQDLEVVVVDLEIDVLCSLAAELNKMLGTNNLDFSVRRDEAKMKYVGTICDSVLDIITNKKPPVVILYSHSAEISQVVINSLVPAT